MGIIIICLFYYLITFLYRSIVEAHPDIVGIPVMPSIEQRIGVIWKKGKYQNATTEKVIKYIENF